MMLSSCLSVNRYSFPVVALHFWWRKQFDNFCLRLFLLRVFHLLRTPLILAILAALVLCGYTANVADCYLTANTTESQHAACGDHHESEGSSESNACQTACQCVCHSGYALEPVFQVQVSTEAAAIGAYALPTGQFPPDAVPLGIDYPPQIG